MGAIEELVVTIPALAEAHERIKGKPDAHQRALAYVMEIWPDVEEREVMASTSDIIEAQAYEGCHTFCKGLNECKYKGRRPDIALEDLDGFRAVVVRYLPCGKSQESASEANAQRLMANSQLPQRLKGCTFEAYEVKGKGEDIAKAKGLARVALDEGSSLVLAGTAGVGKTHLASAMILERIKDGHPSLFLSVPEFLQALRDEMNGGGGNLFDQAKGTPFLVLDDLGAERGSAWVGEKIYTLINYRYSQQLQTVITTNRMNPTDLAESLGEQGQRIISRLAQMGTWVKVAGKDYRLTKGR